MLNNQKRHASTEAKQDLLDEIRRDATFYRKHPEGKLYEYVNQVEEERTHKLKKNLCIHCSLVDPIL